MKISARPCSRCSSRSRFRYCAWIVRSRLVVGSSAISRRGSQEMPMAPTMRWRMPPDISCGYCVDARLRRRDAHRLQQLARPLPGAARARRPHAPGSARPTWSPMVNSGFSEAIGSCRIIAIRLPRTCRISASDFCDQVLALEQHLAADDPRRGRQHAQDGQRQRALARAGFADDAERLAGVDAQRHVVDRAHHARALRRDVMRREVVEFEQRPVCHRRPAAAAQSWRSCGSSLTRSQSPRRLADSTISMMQQPGNTVSHQ